jgi:hypothetical protein
LSTCVTAATSITTTACPATVCVSSAAAACMHTHTHLYLHLQDDELGDLEEEGAAVAARGTADISAFSSVLDDFLREKVRQHKLPTGVASGPPCICTELLRSRCSACVSVIIYAGEVAVYLRYGTSH